MIFVTSLIVQWTDGSAAPPPSGGGGISGNLREVRRRTPFDRSLEGSIPNSINLDVMFGDGGKSKSMRQSDEEFFLLAIALSLE